MKSYFAIINASIIVEVEADTYKEAVTMALDYASILNSLDKLKDLGVSWEVESVQEVSNEAND